MRGQITALAEARDEIHANHSKAMPIGWVAAVEVCENTKCAAISRAIKAAKEESG